MNPEHPAFSGLPTVTTCDGFRIPIASPDALGVAKRPDGLYSVICEFGTREHELACLDSCTDAARATAAVKLLISVLFSEPTDEEEESETA